MYVADTNKAALDRASQATVDGRSDDIRAFSDLEFDVVIDFAGAATTTGAAIEAVRAGGRVVQVGLGVENALIPVQTLTMKGIQLFGASNAANTECSGFLNLMESGKVSTEVEEIAFEQIPEGLERVRKGGVSSRLVAVF
ncbi:zinc-binding dehydrogenase [Rhodococcus sp. USK10]|uniref:zinc-binding dehydrogenase n=1 Tax=Rhodococcus sp. USK10 TaxID=2789739 RepID=UPI00215137DB|nr:zinc-binding dehydrogenase [Rhodococcus sp. USK10]